MIEYEYSKEVSNLNYYIEYCEKNGYTLKTKNQQIILSFSKNVFPLSCWN